MVRVHLGSAVPRAKVAAHVYSQLGLVHRCPDADYQHAFVSVEIHGIQNVAEDAARDSGDKADSGEVQKIFDARSAQSRDEQGSDGGVQPRGHQPSGWLYSTIIADAHLVRLVPGAA